MRDRTPDCARRRILKLGAEKAKRVDVIPNIAFVHSIECPGGISSCHSKHQVALLGWIPLVMIARAPHIDLRVILVRPNDTYR